MNKSLKPQKTLLGKIKVEALDVTDDQVIYDKIKETYFPGMSDKYETPEVLRLAYKEYIKE
ncbi:hypothetical protein KA013_03470 [Patescibacteria group bacterium]|nr:hypothetical protein [Patescibacteria group bacterium]